MALRWRGLTGGGQAAMSCGVCGIDVGGPEVCVHHYIVDPEWANANRAACDFFHRHVTPPPNPDCVIQVLE